MKRTLKSSWSIERCMQLMVHRGDSLRPELVTLRAHSSLGPLQQHLGQELVFLTGTQNDSDQDCANPDCWPTVGEMHDGHGTCLGEVYRLTERSLAGANGRALGRFLKSVGDYATLQAAKDAAEMINVPLEVANVIEQGVEDAIEEQERREDSAAATQLEQPRHELQVLGQILPHIYTLEMGEAGAQYHAKFKHAHPLPAQWRWHEVWEAMTAASPIQSMAIGPVQLPDNLLSHRNAWLAALERLVELEPESYQPDRDEKGFWKHELQAMRDMYANLDALQMAAVSEEAWDSLPAPV
ncbi:hypothetical protein IPC1130_31450 [Pseudomonas aeruginosa]|uniref:hypothetical protein n=1 Tax=Pseudomonas aeruginosa TaxID=287 RepID=UPI000FD223B9|nr:hypothetical protein [Pseudomonas aeruginosa]RUF51811.1 hypothetical protein IPC1130_31450 [Pseudomonas aeruginosa]